jgi:hypothetical protein
MRIENNESFSVTIIEGTFNRMRRHSSLAYLSPSDYEQATMEKVALA